MPAEMYPYKVLVVDDHVMARQIILGVIQGLGIHQIEMAANGSEARDMIYAAYDAGRPFDVVFLDWNLPDIIGIDVLKHFRTHPEFSATGFIMVTAKSEQDEVLMAAKAGATTYIVKPASKEVITKKFLETVEWVKKQKAKGSGFNFPPRK